MNARTPPARTPRSDLVDTWIRALSDERGPARRDARRALVRLGPPAVGPLAQRLTEDPRDGVRWEAARALVEIADPSAGEALVAALADDDSGVRYLAADGLVRLGSEGLRVVLQALIEHAESPLVREGALHVLREQAGDHDVEAGPVLAAMLGSAPVESVIVAAFDALERLARRPHC